MWRLLFEETIFIFGAGERFFAPRSHAKSHVIPRIWVVRL